MWIFIRRERMKVFSKIASLVLGAAFVFVFASCNAGSDDDSLIAKYILFQEYQESLITHTVTFETNGGTEIKSQIVRHKGKAEKPEVPEPAFSTPGLFSDEEIILDEILSADTDNMTPMSALQAISRWKKTLSGR